MKNFLVFVFLFLITFFLFNVAIIQANLKATLKETNITNNKGYNDKMEILIDNHEYQVVLFDSATKDDLLTKLPLNLTLTRYTNHEFKSNLPVLPKNSSNTTSNILAGHIYYWDAWNSFVINYEDYDISPNKVVHIGEITDKSIIDYLRNSNDTIKVKIIKNSYE